MYGKDYGYAKTRLEDTIVRLDGKPVRVAEISERTGNCHAFPLDGSVPVSTNVDALNLKPVPLGWCNTKYGATYLSRIPQRRDWRQGLRNASIHSSMGNIPHSQPELGNTIMGVYPTLKLVLKNLGSPKTAKNPFADNPKLNRGPKVTNGITAFSRHWAISKDGFLYYKSWTEKVGVYDGKNFKLDPSFAYLNESLQEAIT